MMKKLSKTEFAKRVGATQVSQLRSRVAINEDLKTCYFYGWSATYQGKERLHPLLLETETAELFSRKELEDAGATALPAYLKTLERIKEGELEPRMVLSKHKGEVTTPMTFDYSPAFYMTGVLEELEGGLYFKVEGRTDI